MLKIGQHLSKFWTNSKLRFYGPPCRLQVALTITCTAVMSKQISPSIRPTLSDCPCSARTTYNCIAAWGKATDVNSSIFNDSSCQQYVPSISEVCSLPMDDAVRISNAVSGWLLLLWPLFIEFGRFSVSRSPLSCGFMKLWFCLY